MMHMLRSAVWHIALLFLLVLEVELEEELFGVWVPFRPEFVISLLYFPTWNLVRRKEGKEVCGKGFLGWYRGLQGH